tara:strand:+ start:12487 stop:13692 length:1206 start_codon:yes stop_codon:yes gene_type:complete
MTGLVADPQIHDLTRQELYDLAWAEPLRGIAERLGISGSGLAKVCRQNGIPTPDRGYWTKLKAGKPTIKARLPLREPGMPDILRIGGHRHYYGSALTSQLQVDPESVPEIQPPVFSESIEELTERVRKRIPKTVRASKTMTNLHPQVSRLLAEDAVRKEKERTSPYFVWDKPLFDSPFERRRLRLMSALCMVLTEARTSPRVEGKEGRFSVGIGTQRLSITIEPVKPASPRKKTATATTENPQEPMRLTLPVSTNQGATNDVWEDQDDLPLEERLKEIVLAVIVGGELSYRSGCLRGYKWDVERRHKAIDEVRKKRAEQARLGRERIERIQAEQLKALTDEAAAWRQAAEIRSYVAAVQAEHAKRAISSEASLAWANWALAEADRIDPLRRDDVRQDLLSI